MTNAVPRARIVMVADNLGPGGTQRQLCLIATSLRSIGFSIKVIIYQPNTFFADELQKHEIPIVYLKSRNLLHLAFLLRQELRLSMPDVVIGFYHRANLLVVLSGFSKRSFSVIVSERSLDLPGAMHGIRYRLKRAIRYRLHRYADVIVSNSYAQGEIVEQIMRRSTPRTVVIVNGVDTSHFQPDNRTDPTDGRRLKLLVAARLSPEKNALRLIEAVHVVKSLKPAIGIDVDWYGDVVAPRAVQNRLLDYFREVKEEIERSGIEDCFHIHPAQKDVRELYLRSDALCLPSLIEGCSNVIAEAMACGIPVLASRVGDNARLVEDGRNGFLFDPLSVDDIAKTIIRFAELPVSTRQALGREGRNLAESLLSVDTLATRYAELIAKVTDDKRPRTHDAVV